MNTELNTDISLSKNINVKVQTSSVYGESTEWKKKQFKNTEHFW